MPGIVARASGTIAWSQISTKNKKLPLRLEDRRGSVHVQVASHPNLYFVLKDF